MKASINIGLFIGCLLFFIAACDRPECKNANPVFDNFSPESKEYKAELGKQLKLIDNSKLSYWLEKYQVTDEQEFLYFYVQGEGLCAKLHLTMKQWNKIENVRAKKGVSYRGAEFVNLKFDIIQDSTGTLFLYKNLDSIID